MGYHTRSDIAGYILAGGKGKRMGEKDKLYLKYQGKYLARWTMETLDMLEHFYISVAKVPEEIIGNAEWILDIYEKEGPLGGILSGLLICREKALFVVPCDSYGVDKVMAERLISEYERTGGPVFYQSRGEIAPFPGIYTKAMIPVMERHRKAGNYRMRSLFVTNEAQNYSILDGREELCKIFNLNTQEDYNMFQRRNHEREDTNSERSAKTDQNSSI